MILIIEFEQALHYIAVIFSKPSNLPKLAVNVICYFDILVLRLFASWWTPYHFVLLRLVSCFLVFKFHAIILVKIILNKYLKL
jgi:hypothetical protein